MRIFKVLKHLHKGGKYMQLFITIRLETEQNKLCLDEFRLRTAKGKLTIADTCGTTSTYLIYMYYFSNGLEIVFIHYETVNKATINSVPISIERNSIRTILSQALALNYNALMIQCLIQQNSPTSKIKLSEYFEVLIDEKGGKLYNDTQAA
jgi:hypothetical protein